MIFLTLFFCYILLDKSSDNMNIEKIIKRVDGEAEIFFLYLK